MENIYIIEKNLFESDAPVFCHQVNCLGVMGSGVAKSVREIFPDVYEKYRDICVKNEYLVLLGHTAIIQSDNRYIANMFAQERFGYDGKRYTSYDAFYNCLIHIRDFCEKNTINKIALPYKIGSDRGGADWNVIYSMIESVFAKTNIMVEICRI